MFQRRTIIEHNETQRNDSYPLSLKHITKLLRRNNVKIIIRRSNKIIENEVILCYQTLSIQSADYVIFDNMPVVSDNRPVESDNMPVESDNMPVESDNMPVDSDNMPVHCSS